MPSVFTTLQSSRFLNQEAAVAEFRACALRAKAACDEVVAIHLFGSLAAGTATPRSDADIIVEVACGARAKDAVREAVRDAFLDAPLPVDLFVRSSAELVSGRGVAGALAECGFKLA